MKFFGWTKIDDSLKLRVVAALMKRFVVFYIVVDFFGKNSLSRKWIMKSGKFSHQRRNSSATQERFNFITERRVVETRGEDNLWNFIRNVHKCSATQTEAEHKSIHSTRWNKQSEINFHRKKEKKFTITSEWKNEERFLKNPLEFIFTFSIYKTLLSPSNKNETWTRCNEEMEEQVFIKRVFFHMASDWRWVMEQFYWSLAQVTKFYCIKKIKFVQFNGKRIFLRSEENAKFHNSTQLPNPPRPLF